MFLDVLIAVLLAILTCLVSGLAGQLAATKPWHKWFFWGSGLLMVVLIGVQTYRNATTQRDLEVRLAKIQKNTETPPVVNVSPPTVNVEPQISIPTNKAKAYVDVDHLELKWAHSESRLFVDVYATNEASEPAQNVNARFGVGFMPAINGFPTRQTQDKAFADFEKLPHGSSFRGVLGPHQEIYGTIIVTAFDQHFLDGLNSGGQVSMVVGRISFSDDNGTHRKDYCVFLQPPLLTSPTGPVVTHFCDTHNDLRY
jgi:hypothetical protein